MSDPIHDLDEKLHNILREDRDKWQSEAEDLQAIFDLRHSADMRAIAQWRAESPVERDLIMPDHADLCVWLLDKLDRADADGRAQAFRDVDTWARRLESDKNMHPQLGIYADPGTLLNVRLHCQRMAEEAEREH